MIGNVQINRLKKYAQRFQVAKTIGLARLSYLFARWLERLLAYTAPGPGLRRKVDPDVDEYHDAARNVERSERRVQHVPDVLAQLEEDWKAKKR